MVEAQTKLSPICTLVGTLLVAFIEIERRVEKPTHPEPARDHVAKMAEACMRVSMSVAAKQTPRNATCPCGSGNKFKRCCGKDAPPVLNRAA